MMDLTKQEQHTLVHIFLDIGEMMLCSGAEIGRVEDTIKRLGKAYGVKRTNIWVITSAMITTIRFNDGREITQSRRISKYEDTNLERVEKLNKLSRICCSNTVDINQLRTEVKKIQQNSISVPKEIIGYAIVAASFAVFFGGNYLDSVISAIIAILIYFLQKFFVSFCPNKMFFLFFAAFVSGSVICCIGKFIPIVNVDKIMIGDIMLMIPGIAITNSVRNMLIGDTISGAVRFVESALWAIGIAFGFVLPMRIIGNFGIDIKSADYILQLIFGLLGALGFSLLFNVSGKKIFYSTIGGLVCIAAFLFMQCIGFNFFVSSVFAAAICGLYAELLSRLVKAPTTVFLTPSLVPLVPGGLLYYTMNFAVNGNFLEFYNLGWKTIGYAFGISIGISVVSAMCYLISKFLNLFKRI